MTCAGLETLSDKSLAGILAYPNSCFYYTWGLIMAVIWIVLAFSLYHREKERVVNPDILSILGISSIAIIFLSLIGTTFNIIQHDVFIEILVFGFIFIAIWFFKSTDS
jgi:hypothetical protein